MNEHQHGKLVINAMKEMAKETSKLFKDHSKAVLRHMPPKSGNKVASLLLDYKERADELASDLAKDYIKVAEKEARKQPIGQWQPTDPWPIMDHFIDQIGPEIGKLLRGNHTDYAFHISEQLPGELEKLSLKTEESFQEIRWLELKSLGR